MVINKNSKYNFPILLRLTSDLSLTISISLLLLFFYVLYQIWDLLFYIILLILAYSFIRVLTLKTKGIVIDPSEQRELVSILSDVSTYVGTKPLDEIILTPDSSISVSGIFTRKLMIGIGALEGLKKEEFYSILFHEFAHFKGIDNIIGSSLMNLNNGIRNLVIISQKIPSVYGTLIYLTLFAFYYLFNLSTLLYSRQREYLADFVAANFVGGKEFGHSLNTYFNLSNDFVIKINQIIGYYSYQGQRPRNIYEAYRSTKIKFTKDFQDKISEHLDNQYHLDSIFSTHPSIEKRINRISNIPAKIKKLGSGNSLDLFKNMSEKEEKLTKVLYNTNQNS